MQITISVKNDLYRDYLKGIFELNENGSYNLTRYHDFGKAVISLIRYSKLPVEEERTEHSVDLKLPACEPLANAHRSYIYVSKEDEAKLNEYLEVIFNLDFQRHCIEGEKLKFQKRQIIESFIITRKIIRLIGDNETLKKREYRGELKLMNVYAERLLARAKYQNRMIANAIKEYNPLTVI